MKRNITRLPRLFVLCLALLFTPHQLVAAAPPFQDDLDCETLRQEGVELQSQTQYQAALETFQAALVCYQNRPTDNRAEESVVLNHIGAVYDRLGRYNEALESYQQALSQAGDVGNRPGQSTILNNIGAVYDRLERYNEALDVYQQALTIAREVGDHTQY
jgi:tetratricopeptide (TPR) repeat protein